MTQNLRFSRIILALFLMSSIASAWPWPPSLKDLGIEGLIVRRQDDNKNGKGFPMGDIWLYYPEFGVSQGLILSTGTTSSPPATGKATSLPLKTATQATKTGKNSNSAAATTGAAASASGTQTGAAKTSGQAAASTISVNPVLPPGGVNMITPSALAQTTYYKIGDYVSFAWNYTSLSVTPSKVDVIVTCAENSATYALQTNATFKATDSVVWDTGADATGTAPLPMGSYTLVIYDAGAGPTAAAAAGRLGTTDNFEFGMYIPKKYTPRAGKRRTLSLPVYFQPLLISA